MAHRITDLCIGCTACKRVCPTYAITGDKQVQHVIDPTLCIDCSACVRVCPATAIMDQYGVYKERVAKRSDWAKPVVNVELCSGCEFCVSICPFDCLELVGGGPMEGVAHLARPKDCVACRQCEEVCGKNAIVVVTPAEREERVVAAGAQVA